MTLSQDQLLQQARKLAIMPVVVIDDKNLAVPLARALLAGGIGMIEVTLRTPAALSAIAEIRTQLPEMIVGAGTVLSAADASSAQGAGAQFAVSPGYSRELGDHCRANALPLLPGVATASEVMAALSDGFGFLKFFPASACGGPALLKALHGPFPAVSFCPTGGIDASNAADYLCLPNVACIGGSWIASRSVIATCDWEVITASASGAASLAKAAQSGRQRH